MRQEAANRRPFPVSASKSSNTAISVAGMAKITDIVPVAHGASGALVDAQGGLALPLLDYEQVIEGDGYDQVAAPFQETFTPKMANGSWANGATGSQPVTKEVRS